MKFYSLKMRASKHTGTAEEHVSGAEKILREEELAPYMDALMQRALHHAKGDADFVNMKVEAVEPESIAHIDALPVTSVDVATPEEGRQALLGYLSQLGIAHGEAILGKLKETYAMRGAMLLHADTLERMEPDHARGIRATYMDAERQQGCSPSDSKNHFHEALVLASKVANAPHIVAEICISDDPGYVTGYIAAKSIGYVRISKLKAMGCPDGGRIFLCRGSRREIDAAIRYLENTIVLVRHVPERPGHELPPAPCPDGDPFQPIAQDLEQRKAAHLYRTMIELQSPQAAHVRCDGKDMLLLASNNYLGLVDDARVKEAAMKAVADFGTGSGGSRLTTGTLPLHTGLEKALADFKHTEAALLYNTGYMANVGIISAICGSGSVIFSDELNHASIIDGCRLSRAQTVIYRHNDMEDLSAKIREHAPCHGLIVSDAVFSMDGDIVHLPELLALAKKHHLLSMVDEAHSTGVIGKTGHGICEHFDLGMGEGPDILMGTLSKSLASEGGFACGSRLLIDALRNRSRSFIFSTSLSPAVLAAAREALRILGEEPGRVKRLQENAAYFCQCLGDHGIAASSASAIAPIIIGDEEKAMHAAAELFRRGIFLSAIRYPTVKKGSARLRAALMATHTPEELRKAAAEIAGVLAEDSMSHP